MRFLDLVLLAPLVSAAVTSPREEKITYNGYKVFRIATHNDPATVEGQLSSLSAVHFNLDRSKHIDVAIAPGEVADFEALGLDAEVMHEDLGIDLAEEASYKPYQSSSLAAIPSLTWFDSYHPYADHVQYFTDLQSAFPNNSELIQAGTSYQGRSIFGIHLWGSGGKGSKPAVYFHGTVHAREWVSTMVVEYLTYSLITGYTSDTAVKAILDKYDFYILPFVNPDGFVYTQTTNRLWRKNRQPRSGASCIGTDVNRNWPYKWEVTGGASTDPCSETYKGVAAGDTLENTGIRALADTLAAGKGIKLYIDWHSYGQYILFPWGFNCNLAVTNQARQATLATGTANRIAQSYGTKFTTGQSCSTLYATTGSGPDYLTGAAKAEFAWTIELRPTGQSGGGFVLPPAQILPSAKEQWEGMKYLLPTM